MRGFESGLRASVEGQRERESGDAYFKSGEAISILNPSTGRLQSGWTVERVDVVGEKIRVSRDENGQILRQSAPLFETFVANKPHAEVRFPVFDWFTLWQKSGGVLSQSENPVTGKTGERRMWTPAEARAYFNDKPARYDEAKKRKGMPAENGIELWQARLRNAYFGREIPQDLLIWERDFKKRREERGKLSFKDDIPPPDLNRRR